MNLKQTLGHLGILICVFSLVACQTTNTTPVSAEKAISLYAGDWAGHFINRQGTRYPVSWKLSDQNGRLVGQADIPDSTYDEKPSLEGSYDGNKATVASSSGFKFTMTMSVSDKGQYWLKGPVTGPNIGTLELVRQ